MKRAVLQAARLKEVLGKRIKRYGKIIIEPQMSVEERPTVSQNKTDLLRNVGGGPQVRKEETWGVKVSGQPLKERKYRKVNLYLLH